MTDLAHGAREARFDSFNSAAIIRCPPRLAGNVRELANLVERMRHAPVRCDRRGQSCRKKFRYVDDEEDNWTACAVT